MAKKVPYTDLQSLPLAAAELVRLVVKKMRYRKSVRADVMAELAAHFEDALKDCKSEDEREQRAQQLIADFGDVKLLGVLLRRAKKRCRPLWRTIVARTFQAIGGLISCFILYCVYISLGEPMIRINYIEEATRLARPAADEDLNAAPLYQKAIEAYKEPPQMQVEREIVARRLRRGSAPKKSPQRIVERRSLLEAIADKDWIAELNEQELSLLQQWVSGNTEAIEYFRQAAEKPHCWWHRQARDGMALITPMPELNGLRSLTRLTGWQARLKAYNGDTQAAFDDLLSCYRAGMHFKGPRSLIEQIVAIAVQALSVKNALVILHNQQIDDRLLQNFQNELEILIDQDCHTINYKVERFLGLDFIQRCYTDNGDGSGHLIPGRLKEYWQVIERNGTENEFVEYARFLAISLLSPDRHQMSREFEKLYDTCQEWVQKTPWQCKKENLDPEMDLHRWSFLKRVRYLTVYAFAPSAAPASALAHRAKVQMEALVTTIAAIRYQQTYGDYPENLDQLLADHLIKKLPTDPYSDGPLVYKKTDDGFTLYSVGDNFVDDGGEIFRTDTGRVEKWPDEGDAVLWPLETRS